MLSLFDLLKPGYIQTNLTAQNAEEAIAMVNEPLAAAGATTEQYAQDAWERELTFPTGLPTQPFAVAIPHADPDHVHHSAVGVGILAAPIEFSQMGLDASIRLNVHIVFLLAVKEREKQVELIRQIVSMLQAGSLLQLLVESADPEEAYAHIRSALQSPPSS